MRTQWIAAATFASALAVGCGGGAPSATPETTSPATEPAAGAPAAAPAPSPASDTAQEKPSVAPAPAATSKPSRPAPTPTAAPKPGSNSVAQTESPQPQAPPAPRFRPVAAPVGTTLVLELTTALSTETARVEDKVTARLRKAVVSEGITLIPAGAVFHGNVTEVERAGRVKGLAHLVFRFTEVEIGGQRDPVRTNGVAIEGEATKSEDATKVGGGAGIGAVIGGIVGGASGAAKGAAIGGAAGAGTVLATRGRDVNLSVGSEVTATLASPFEIQVEEK